MEAFARETHGAMQNAQAGHAIRAILGWRSIAACLLSIPIPVVESVAGDYSKETISLDALSAAIANLAKDLAHQSVNSVHVLHAMLHLAPGVCDQFLRSCNRLLLEAGRESDSADPASLAPVEYSGEEIARSKNIAGRNVVTPPFVEFVLTRYLTSVWYPFDRKRFQNYSRLRDQKKSCDALLDDSAVMGAFTFTLEHSEGWRQQK